MLFYRENESLSQGLIKGAWKGFVIHKKINSPSKQYWTHCKLASRAKIAKIRQEDSVLTELLKLWWTLILTSSISTRLLMVSVVKTKIIPIIFLSFSIQRSILTTIFARLFIAKIQSCSRESSRIMMETNFDQQH